MHPDADAHPVSCCGIGRQNQAIGHPAAPPGPPAAGGQSRQRGLPACSRSRYVIDPRHDRGAQSRRYDRLLHRQTKGQTASRSGVMALDGPGAGPGPGTPGALGRLPGWRPHGCRPRLRTGRTARSRRSAARRPPRAGPGRSRRAALPLPGPRTGAPAPVRGPGRAALAARPRGGHLAADRLLAVRPVRNRGLHPCGRQPGRRPSAPGVPGSSPSSRTIQRQNTTFGVDPSFDGEAALRASVMPRVNHVP